MMRGARGGRHVPEQCLACCITHLACYHRIPLMPTSSSPSPPPHPLPPPPPADMLHQSILPVHQSFARQLSMLKYVVVDEGHAYRWAGGGLQSEYCNRAGAVVLGPAALGLGLVAFVPQGQRGCDHCSAPTLTPALPWWCPQGRVWQPHCPGAAPAAPRLPAPAQLRASLCGDERDHCQPAAACAGKAGGTGPLPSHMQLVPDRCTAGD